jgi:hypothetical protein
MNGVKLSDSRFWLVEGIVPSGNIASAFLTYDARTNSASSCATCLLDHTWLTQIEDSLLVFWRADRADDWHLVNGFTINYAGSHTDKKGSITIDTLRTGEYALGMLDYTAVSTDPSADASPLLTVSPNPAANEVTLALSRTNGCRIEILDVNGRRLRTEQVPAGKSGITLSTQSLAEGMYFVYCVLPSGKSSFTRLMIAR